MTSVKLYVYDLSNGMVRQLSRQLTGRQIDGIWHTSVVVFGKEVFYGQGINTTAPGRSHHGSPMQVIDMGETALDEDTFNEYIQEMSQHYTADKYHLLEFNCNSFTDDCVGFLTGGSIPSFIKDLPTDFLSTPFGAALRPTIDAMYRRPTPGPAAAPAPSAGADPQLAASILQAVASQAQGGMPTQAAAHPNAATNSLTAPVHVVTNPASFKSFLGSHKAAVAFFTSETCPPCKMIEPVFERLAEEKGTHGGRNGAGFAKVDIDVGLGSALALEWKITATPTFIFFLDGKKSDQLLGADRNELRTQVDLLLFQVYPPHPHTSVPMPAIQALSMNPILFSQVPPIDTVLSKLASFIDAQPWPPSTALTKAQAISTLSGTVGPYLKSRFATTPPPAPLPSATPAILVSWAQTTAVLASVLPVDSLFPLVDMWRLAFLDPAVGIWAATAIASQNPISAFLPKALATPTTAPSKGARNYLLTVLRMLCNAFSSLALAQRILGDAQVRGAVMGVLVPSLLHDDATVRTAGASLAFDIAAVVQKRRVEAVRTGRGIMEEDEAEEGRDEWDVEMISALLEAVDRERENEEVVHRLVAALAFFLRLSPQYQTQLAPLLQVLQSKDILRRKLSAGDGWTAAGGIAKKEVKKLVEEVAEKLCA
ncbi:thioredoxin family protein [Pholiota conissans]|uniref:Thioredoxin family protein n=1 Tax=Pholiota conissans TaxID=109636 RepID=A0A9P5Z3C5_9AGAR|nr:thioredoxin family protein [Pholiota conissans]